jgi:hypothetical protein
VRRHVTPFRVVFVVDLLLRYVVQRHVTPFVLRLSAYANFNLKMLRTHTGSNSTTTSFRSGAMSRHFMLRLSAYTSLTLYHCAMVHDTSLLLRLERVHKSHYISLCNGTLQDPSLLLRLFEAALLCAVNSTAVRSATPCDVPLVRVGVCFVVVVCCC